MLPERNRSNGPCEPEAIARPSQLAVVRASPRTASRRAPWPLRVMTLMMAPRPPCPYSTEPVPLVTLISAISSTGRRAGLN